jgi:hypothetical protein
MKKSEMIERLRCFLSEQQGYGEDSSYVEYIVNFLVSQGMQPPPYKKLVVQPYGTGLYGLGNQSLSYELTVNEWEKEND